MSLTKVIQGMISAGSITAAAVTMATGKLLGRSTAGTGAIEEITIGTGLSLTGGTLAATGGGVSSFNTRTGAITLTTADVNNTIVTGNQVGAVHLATYSRDPYSGLTGFAVGSSYSCTAGEIIGTNNAKAIIRTDDNNGLLTVTGTWKCLDIHRLVYSYWDGVEMVDSYINAARFMRVA